jgi:hypothetical protein
MPLHLRVDLPDGPGALAQVTRALAAAEVDVLSVHVVDRADGRATDDFLLSWPSDTGLDRLRRSLAMLPAGYRLLALRRVVAVPDENPALDLLTGALAQPQRSVETLVDLVPSAAAADWAAVVARGATATAVYASASAPVPLPALPGDLPRATSLLHECGAVVSVPLPGTHLVLMAVRTEGPPFLRREVADLTRLVQLAMALVSAGSAATASEVTRRAMSG